MVHSSKGPPPMNCPICEKESVPSYRPFCSRRCADVDLGKWLTGAYSVPAVDEGEEDASDDVSQERLN